MIELICVIETERYIIQNKLWLVETIQAGCGQIKFYHFTGLLCFVWFNGISTTVGYLMPNLVYSYILDIYDL